MVKPLWWIPILICIIAGIVYLIPSSSSSGPVLAYQALIPLAPIPSIIMWILGFGIFMLARWSTERPLRPM